MGKLRSRKLHGTTTDLWGSSIAKFLAFRTLVTRQWGQARLGLSCFPVQQSPVPSGLAEAVYASLKATAPALGVLERPHAYT